MHTLLEVEETKTADKNTREVTNTKLMNLYKKRILITLTVVSRCGRNVTSLRFIGRRPSVSILSTGTLNLQDRLSRCSQHTVYKICTHTHTKAINGKKEPNVLN